jgi:hypothetical protein
VKNLEEIMKTLRGYEEFYSLIENQKKEMMELEKTGELTDIIELCQEIEENKKEKLEGFKTKYRELIKKIKKKKIFIKWDQVPLNKDLLITTIEKTVFRI